MLLIKISYCQRISAYVHAHLQYLQQKQHQMTFGQFFLFLYEDPIGLFFIVEGVSFDFKQSKNFPSNPSFSPESFRTNNIPTRVLASMSHLRSTCPVIPNLSSPLLLLISTPRQPNQRNAQSVTQCIPTAPQWQAADTNFHSSSR